MSSSSSSNTPQPKNNKEKEKEVKEKEKEKTNNNAQPQNKPTTTTTPPTPNQSESPILNAFIFISFFVSLLGFSYYLFTIYIIDSSSSSSSSHHHQIPNFSDAQKLRDTHLALTVQLEDVYMGKEYALSIPRQEICHECKGHGSIDKNDVKKCTKCDGKGILLVNHRFGNFMMQSQDTCNVCKGKGKVISKPCKVCSGTGIEHTHADIKVNIKAGIPEDHVITLQGQGDQAPEFNPGDLHFHINTQPHDFFVRKGQHLYCNHTINLLDSLIGFKHTLKHLDGKEIILEGNGNKVTPFGFEEIIYGKGLPSDSVWQKNGNLYVLYDIDFPDYFDPLEKETITQLLIDDVTSKQEEEEKGET